MRVALGAALAALGLACAPEEPPRHLVWISLDTLRRDHLPTYGYARDTAPAIDALARSGVVFDEAFAQHTNTLPSHASMFTGLYAHAHGSRANGQPLPAGRTALAQVLAAAGFRTAAFVSSTTLAARASGLERGFQVYDDAFDGGRRDGQATALRAREWWSGVAEGERAFLFVHLYDPHGPYRPPGRYAELFRSPEPGPRLREIPSYQLLRDAAGRPLLHRNAYVDRYDGAIRYADDQVAGLVEGLDLERSLLVLLADHGETLDERRHVLDHGGQVFDEQIRIPLILRGAGLDPGRIAEPVETVDLLPTVLELLGVAAPAGTELHGHSLVPLLRGGGFEPGPVFASSRAIAQRHRDRGYRFPPGAQIHSLRTDRWKLILYPDLRGERLELYDLAADPAERDDRAAREPRVRGELRARLGRWLALERPAPPPPPLDPELREQLDALGYGEP